MNRQYTGEIKKKNNKNKQLFNLSIKYGNEKKKEKKKN